MNTPEISKETRVKMPLGTIVALCVACLSLGGTISKVLSHSEDIDNARKYTEQEVSGLRSDWERRNKDVEKRLDKLEGLVLEQNK